MRISSLNRRVQGLLFAVVVFVALLTQTAFAQNSTGALQGEVQDATHARIAAAKQIQDFHSKTICDATKSTEVLLCLSSLSRDEVNEMVRKAVAAGVTTYKEPQDHGFMYGHKFQDLDGHIWELVFMEPSASKSA